MRSLYEFFRLFQTKLAGGVMGTEMTWTIKGKGVNAVIARYTAKIQKGRTEIATH